MTDESVKATIKRGNRCFSILFKAIKFKNKRTNFFLRCNLGEAGQGQRVGIH